ncbi:hypothetical protein PHLGIDRAFT_94663 [Phlebiopsis gigantea 11061_1 CR5-6]|uniref:FAD/NAD(P)-binding domain-containing protein n=1 Tax=Phlebiopsis gigantea (strain 11061_1 CR5-6) TaxID=745531 RepID=A0A0C3S216_PHLG1|nr:hypothetical protein PHLGIDRAFT_94663 [Phlebiopsis gigantea 11061_1 CR5-6]
MQAHPITTSLPTFAHLGVEQPKDVDAEKIARAWVAALGQFVSARDVKGILSNITEDGWWRDVFSITWDLRTFQGPATIAQFLEDKLEDSGFGNISFRSAQYGQPFDDMVWIVAQFDFETKIAKGRGLARLVPTPAGWKAVIVCTNLEDLKDFPEQIGSLRNHLPNHGKWAAQRSKEKEFAETDPEVLIIGGGQSGLDIAARLKHLGVSNLIIEKQPRIGHQWRTRYEALCLHDPVWFDHMPYLNFPPNWPVYTPAQKLAGWLEYYAEAMELNVWLSSIATSATRNPETGKWHVTVKRNDGTERLFHVDHVVFALGLGAGKPNVPTIPGQEDFKGQVLHSTAHRSAKDHLGKKVVVIGACTSAHDICADYADHGVDVTIYQRSSTYIMSTKEGMPALMKPNYWEGGPPTDEADRLDNSVPILFGKLIAQRKAARIKQQDAALLEGLTKVGYKLNDGEDNSGFVFLALKRAGGYYLDVGACQLIIDGKIKLKNGTQIERFTEKGLKFEDGSELEADVVVFATGFADARGPIRDIVGEEEGSKIPTIWGLNKEGEIRVAWREIGLPNMWYMMGNLAWSRFFSKHLALQIKAKQEGIFPGRYSAPVEM